MIAALYAPNEIAAAKALYEHETGPDKWGRHAEFEQLAEPTLGAYVSAVRAVVNAWQEVR